MKLPELKLCDATPRLCDCTPEPSCSECEKWYADRTPRRETGTICEGCGEPVDDKGVCYCA